MTDEPIQTSDNIWDALKETPEEAAIMTLRSDLRTTVQDVVESWQLIPDSSCYPAGCDAHPVV